VTAGSSRWVTTTRRVVGRPVDALVLGAVRKDKDAVVEALENGDWSRLPKGTFLRGFVRNYTRLLGLNPDAALHALSQAAPSVPAPGIVVPSQNIRFEPIGERLSSPYVKAWGVAGVAIALGFAAMYWWIFIRPAPPAASLARKETVASPVVPQNIAVAPVPPPDPVVPREAPKEEIPAKAEAAAPRMEEPKPQAVKAEAAKAEAAKAEPPLVRPKKPADVVAASVATPVAAPPQARVAAGERTLRLRFKGPSWVEIKDRSGKVLLSKVNEAGSEMKGLGKFDGFPLRFEIKREKP